jgi:hypothetical protein
MTARGREHTPPVVEGVEGRNGGTVAARLGQGATGGAGGQGKSGGAAAGEAALTRAGGGCSPPPGLEEGPAGNWQSTSPKAFRRGSEVPNRENACATWRKASSTVRSSQRSRAARATRPEQVLGGQKS